MSNQFLISKLSEALAKERPGFRAQARMSPVGKESIRYYQAPESALKASVLMTIYEKENRWHTTFLKRTRNKSDKHSGQISLPGGRFSRQDKNAMDCALRETEEEIGISRTEVEILGELSHLYVFASNHFVYPFVGVLSKEPTFQIDTREVQSVIEVSLDFLADDKNIKKKDLYIRDIILRDVPYYDLEGEVLWGATAMMVSEFINIWKSVNEF